MIINLCSEIYETIDPPSHRITASDARLHSVELLYASSLEDDDDDEDPQERYVGG